MSLRSRIVAMFSFTPPPPDIPTPEPRDPYPCPVRGCTDPVRIIAQDEQTTTVHCDTYDCYTSYDTTLRVVREQRIIRVQDGWHQHATKGPPRGR